MAAATERYLAVDLGAESGRAMAAALDGRRLTLEEVRRFPNGPIRVSVAPAGRAPHEALHWNVLALWREIKAGMADFRSRFGVPASIGIDTWGVDYALLGSDGALLGNPYNYRDPRTNGMLAAAFDRVPKEEIFERTGIQFMPINTLYQLLAAELDGSSALRAASTFVMVPDLFNYWLTGRVACEFTDATTTQAYDPRARRWATDLLDRLGIRSDVFPEIVQPGTALGTLLPLVVGEVGLPATTRVTAVASHDTGSAVAAVPVDPASLPPGETYAYISSGTWSLVGGETPEPVITPEALRFNFTNEGGVGSFRLLKNVMGLWLVQECRRAWRARGDDLTYEQLAGLAAGARPFAALVDPDDAAFLPPGDMPQRFADFCRRTGQAPLHPAEKGQVVRCALESLSLKYRWVVERLEHLLQKRVAVIHVIGGGSQNALLNQLTADACNRPVVAGPAEATALGNVLVQAFAAGRLSSPAEGRDLIRRSFPLHTFEPQAPARWDEAYARFVSLVAA
ncbi:MAG: rhamnulokinase [Chloroflexi bacterium]|nr:rhamnulokinase [Chloroflexota bacterium]